MPGTGTSSLPTDLSMTRGRQSSAMPRHGTTILMSLPCWYARTTPCSRSFTRWALLPPAQRPNRSSPCRLSPVCWPHASRRIPRLTTSQSRPRVSRPANDERHLQPLLRFLVLERCWLDRHDGLHLLLVGRHNGSARPSLGCSTSFRPSLFTLDMPLFALRAS